MTLIKLCGLQRKEDVEIANALQPDFAGFVLVQQSRRYIDYIRLEQMRQILSPQIKAVGVFADTNLDEVAFLLEKGLLDMVQLHGHEDERYLKQLKLLTDRPIIKAFGINSRDDIYRAEQSSADYILLDTAGGGTGRTFDWSLLNLCKRAYFLAGGLDPDNVGKAIENFHPYGVDVSSGIESDGHKDGKKAERFMINAGRMYEEG